MEQACKDLGLKFVFESAPDPTSDVGVAGAQQFLLEKVPQWAAQFGGPNNDKVAFFCTNDAQNEPVIKCVVAAKNALYPRTRLGFPAHGLPRRAEPQPGPTSRATRAAIMKLHR